MTNKEAIEKLGYIKNQYHVMLNFTDYDEVFDKAIDALKFIDNNPTIITTEEDAERLIEILEEAENETD